MLIWDWIELGTNELKGEPLVLSNGTIASRRNREQSAMVITHYRKLRTVPWDPYLATETSFVLDFQCTFLASSSEHCWHVRSTNYSRKLWASSVQSCIFRRKSRCSVSLGLHLGVEETSKGHQKRPGFSGWLRVFSCDVSATWIFNAPLSTRLF